jgi:hypothetical protein
MARMRVFVVLAAIVLPWAAPAWDTPPHQRITRAALDSLPPQVLQRFGAETAPLVEIYCIYPDRFAEMEQFGFVRKGPGPKTSSEIHAYCVRPDGGPVHGATGDSEDDLASLAFLFERIAASFHASRPDEAAKYAGVLSHFIEDSLSPPHAVEPERLKSMVPSFSNCGRVNLHSAIEQSVPEFRLGRRAPRSLGGSARGAAEAALERLYAGAETNRKSLPGMVTAACAGDQTALDAYRFRAGSEAAAILADALYTVARWESSDR